MTLSFCQLEIIAPQIAEVVVSRGVEITGEMAGEYNTALLKLFPAGPFAVLVNKKNDYSHTVEAMKLLGAIERKRAAAIYLPPGRRIGGAFLRRFRSESEYLSKDFNDYDDAVRWLKEQLARAEPQSASPTGA